MSTGHYTSYVKSQGNWYYYDDARPYQVDPEDITVGNAYILFYIRRYSFYDVRDLINKSIKEIMPNLEVPFIGKPVNTKLGLHGYITDIRENLYCKYVVECFGLNAKLYLRYVCRFIIVKMILNGNYKKKY